MFRAYYLGDSFSIENQASINAVEAAIYPNLEYAELSIANLVYDYEELRWEDFEIRTSEDG